jgi:hypothetical protein
MKDSTDTPKHQLTIQFDRRESAAPYSDRIRLRAYPIATRLQQIRSELHAPEPSGVFPVGSRRSWKIIQ